MVGQIPAVPARFFLRRPEIDDPRVAVIRQIVDCAELGRDVVDIAGDHQRRHQQNRRSIGPSTRIASQAEDLSRVGDLAGGLVGPDVAVEQEIGGISSGPTQPVEGALHEPRKFDGQLLSAHDVSDKVS